MAKILTDSWQIAENLTDYWHLPLVLLSTDKGPDCPLFSPNPVFKALSSIVPLFSSDNVIKCALLGVILAARRLTLKNAKCVKFNISLPPPSGSKKALNESLVFDWRGEIWVARVSGGGGGGETGREWAFVIGSERSKPVRLGTAYILRKVLSAMPWQGFPD